MESQKCPIHLMEIVAFDLKSSTHKEDKMLCLRCLTQKIDLNNLQLMNETKEIFLEMKMKAKSLSQEENSKHLENLQSLLSQLQEYKMTTESIINKLILNVEHKINLIKSELNETNNNQEVQINQADILMLSQYYQDQQFVITNEMNQNQDFQQFISSSLIQLEIIQKSPLYSKIIDSFQKLQQVLFQTNQLQIKNREDRGFEKHKTPHLDQKCAKHKKEIIMLNLNSICQGTRLACVKCVQENPIQYTDLEEANIQWENIYQQSHQQFKQISDKRKKQKEKLIDIIQKWKEKYDLLLNQMIHNIQQHSLSSKNEIESQSKIENKQLFNLDETELMQAIQILSQSQNQFFNQDFIQYEKEDQIFYKELQDRIKHLINFEIHCNEQINELLNTQDQQITKNIYYNENVYNDELYQEFQEFQSKLAQSHNKLNSIKEFLTFYKQLLEQKTILQQKLTYIKSDDQINLQKKELISSENLKFQFLEFESRIVESFNNVIQIEINQVIQEKDKKIEELNKSKYNLENQVQQQQIELEKEMKRVDEQRKIYEINQKNMEQKIKLLQEEISLLHHNFRGMQEELKIKENLIMNLNKEKTQISQTFVTLKEVNLDLENYSKDLIFSTKFKQDEIKILENGKIAYAEKNIWQVCVCEQSIPKERILQMHQFYAGICFRDIISKDYRGYVSELGHGYYLMCKDGFIYSHHEKEKNGQKLGFKFQPEDIIDIEVDIKQKLIKWENEKQKQSFTLSIEINNLLFPCFRLASSKVLLLQC